MSAAYRLVENQFVFDDQATASAEQRHLAEAGNSFLNSDKAAEKRDDIIRIVSAGLTEDGNPAAAMQELEKLWHQAKDESTAPANENVQPKLMIELCDEGQPKKMKISYKWADTWTPSTEEIKLEIALANAEGDLRTICINRTEGSYLYWVLDWLYPSQVPANENDYKRLMRRLVDIGQTCLATTPIRPERAEALIRKVLEDAILAFSMKRRAEIAFRFGSALLVTLIISAVVLFLFNITAQFYSPVVHVPASKSTLVVVFLLAVAVSAWASYMQRSMSIVERSLDAELGDIKVFISDTIHPAARALYVFIFCFIALVLLHLEIVSVKLGPFDTSMILEKFGVALFAGLLLGLAERTLPTAMVSRAHKLAESLGGGQQQTAKP